MDWTFPTNPPLVVYPVPTVAQVVISVNEYDAAWALGILVVIYSAAASVDVVRNVFAVFLIIFLLLKKDRCSSIIHNKPVGNKWAQITISVFLE